MFCAHAVLLPIDGCSINPARSLGPAVVSGEWADGKFWIFVVGEPVGIRESKSRSHVAYHPPKHVCCPSGIHVMLIVSTKLQPRAVLA